MSGNSSEYKKIGRRFLMKFWSSGFWFRPIHIYVAQSI